MARCLKSAKHMRLVFYGAMVCEGVIALIWAAVALGFYRSGARLGAALAAGDPGAVVHDTCIATMGLLGGILAVLGVVVLPITSGDTAFRVGRLILADHFRVPQTRFVNRYRLEEAASVVGIMQKIKMIGGHEGCGFMLDRVLGEHKTG